ncbi:mechanosensitive ion channel domain-containing protein [Crocosphaera sp. Alani8]|uniref:mechanosensitive ion channel domain-containing protein n=1 Tax=Crocosphaera sp. Alani8 TaxID=3038952 RepID=UPI00313D7DB8
MYNYWLIIKQWFQQTFSTPLLSVGGEEISILWVLKALILLILVSILARGTKRFLKNYLLVALRINEGTREVIGTLSSLSLGTLGYIIVLQGLGLDLASFAVVVGGLGVGIGFGLQEITKNLVSGLTLLGESKLKVGDLIEFQGHLGYIQEISLRSTVIKTFKGSQLVIPNTDLTSLPVENWNYENCHGRIEISIGVAYNSDLLLVTELLLESAFLEQEVLTYPSPQVVFIEYGDNALIFELWVWVANIERRQSIKSSLNFIIEYKFRQGGISIPFPQRELWLKNTESFPSNNFHEVSNKQSSSNHITLKDSLKSFPCFKHLNELELRKLIEVGSRHYLKKEEIFINRGEYGSHFCIVLSGQMQAIYETTKVSRLLFTFNQGEYFGELPLLLEVPYPTTMIASEDTHLFLLAKECFQNLLNQYPYLAKEIASELAKRQETLEEYRNSLQEMGLIDDESLQNPVVWIRQRLSDIFSF